MTPLTLSAFMDGMRWDLWENRKKASHPPLCQCD